MTEEAELEQGSPCLAGPSSIVGGNREEGNLIIFG